MGTVAMTVGLVVQHSVLGSGTRNVGQSPTLLPGRHFCLEPVSYDLQRSRTTRLASKVPPIRRGSFCFLDVSATEVAREFKARHTLIAILRVQATGSAIKKPLDLHQAASFRDTYPSWVDAQVLF